MKRTTTKMMGRTGRQSRLSRHRESFSSTTSRVMLTSCILEACELQRCAAQSTQLVASCQRARLGMIVIATPDHRPKSQKEIEEELARLALIRKRRCVLRRLYTRTLCLRLQFVSRYATGVSKLTEPLHFRYPAVFSGRSRPRSEFRRKVSTGLRRRAAQLPGQSLCSAAYVVVVVFLGMSDYTLFVVHVVHDTPPGHESFGVRFTCSTVG